MSLYGLVFKVSLKMIILYMLFHLAYHLELKLRVSNKDLQSPIFKEHPYR